VAAFERMLESEAPRTQEPKRGGHETYFISPGEEILPQGRGLARCRGGRHYSPYTPGFYSDSPTGRMVPKASSHAEISAEGVAFETAQMLEIREFSLWHGDCVVREAWNRKT
jgi:hypothetical protein